MPYPEGWRHWTHVKGMVIEPGNALYETFGGIHHLYANRKAEQGYRQGTYPDGSVIVFDLLEAKSVDRPNPVGQRTVWLGNAAQTLHPVAGQGYNLALRDVWACAQVLLKAGGDPGAADTLATYARERHLDRQGTIRVTDGLVRLFSNALGPLLHARGAGLLALDLIPPARHFVAKRMMFGARAWP